MVSTELRIPAVPARGRTRRRTERSRWHSAGAPHTAGRPGRTNGESRTDSLEVESGHKRPAVPSWVRSVTNVDIDGLKLRLNHYYPNDTEVVLQERRRHVHGKY